MEWMLDIQLGRRNLSPIQRIAVMDKFKKKIEVQAANKANESRSKFHGKQYTEVSSPNGDHTKIKTDKEFGNNQYSLPNNSVSTQSDLAAQMGISVDTLQNYKMLADMIPELDDLVQTD